MAATVLADTSFIQALVDARDTHHNWALACARQFPPPWSTCESVLSEAFFLLGPLGGPALMALLDRGSLRLSFQLAQEQDRILSLMRKYSDLPMSLADACLVRMTETHPDPTVLTTDSDFLVYRRHGRQAVPCVLP